MPTATPSSGWTQLTGPELAPVQTDARGRLTFVVPALSAVVLRAESDLPRRGTVRATLRVGADRFTNLKVVTAAITGGDPVSVTVAVRRKGSATWKRLGVDDGAPYRVFVDPRGFGKGEVVSLVAVARASDGSVSTSPVLSVVLR